MINIKSNYSLLSSMIKIDDIIKYSLDNNFDYAFISDTNMYACMKFYNACRDNNIKPIIGININLDDFKINLYALNYDGYKSMIKLSTIQNERVVKIEDLKEFNNSLLCVVYYESKNSHHWYEFLYNYNLKY